MSSISLPGGAGGGVSMGVLQHGTRAKRSPHATSRANPALCPYFSHQPERLTAPSLFWLESGEEMLRTHRARAALQLTGLLAENRGPLTTNNTPRSHFATPTSPLPQRPTRLAHTFSFSSRQVVGFHFTKESEKKKYRARGIFFISLWQGREG